MTKNVILGTAGHIDHGKSSLVKALTGIDPDRLKEEKQRGITIDLGFANLVYPDDDLIVGIVDVPGHEKLIRNMLAGAGGIDILVMVISADEGIMPQSREHLAICNLLKIKTGLIALTKIDTVEHDWIELISDEIRDFVKRTFLEDAPIVPVSSRTGEGIDKLKDLIKEIAKGVSPKLTGGLFRLPIDRVFTLKGFGTVVTGTALSGEALIDMPVEILPSGIKSKIRGLQTHGKTTNRAFAGQRIGINLQGVEKDQLKRGDVVVSPSRFKATKVIDASLDMLSDAPILKDRSLIHIYVGTSETTARVILYDKTEVTPSESCYCQFRLEDEIVALSGDRYIIRRFSPLETIGGGTILDPKPNRRRKKEGIEDLFIYDKGTISEKIFTKIKKSAIKGLTNDFIEGWISGDLKEIKDNLKMLIKDNKVVQANDLYLCADFVIPIRERLKDIIKRYHAENPLKLGLQKEELRVRLSKEIKSFLTDSVYEFLIKTADVSIEKDIIKLSEFKAELSSVDSSVKNKILKTLQDNKFQPPIKTELQQMTKMNEKEIKDLLNLMTKEGLIVRINETIYITKKTYEELVEILKGHFRTKKEITLSEFRDLLNTSRKYALPFMEYLDSQKVTLRIGDIRKLMIK
ncbi:MAG TPA: selenocysteine-specific translation elongation factor [Nitrospirae bacterium]|nr:selenocysteine-specific translation elongation factor [Nitrospirota bacterium]